MIQLYALNHDGTFYKKAPDDVMNSLSISIITSNYVSPTDVDDTILVSTVFLGLDYGIPGQTILLFETMVFRRNEYSGDAQRRHSTIEDARLCHSRYCMDYERRGYTFIKRDDKYDHLELPEINSYLLAPEED